MSIFLRVAAGAVVPDGIVEAPTAAKAATLWGLRASATGAEMIVEVPADVTDPVGEYEAGAAWRDTAPSLRVKG